MIIKVINNMIINKIINDYNSNTAVVLQQPTLLTDTDSSFSFNQLGTATMYAKLNSTTPAS